MRLLPLCCVCVAVFIQYVTSLGLLKPSVDEPKTTYPSNCVWQQADCIPRKGKCGRGTIIQSLKGENCPQKTKVNRCKVSCGGKRRKNRKKGRLSPSDAGLVGLAVNKASSNAIDDTDFQKLKTCAYIKQDWSDCDRATNRMSRNLTLTQGDPKVCRPNKTIMKQCNRRGGKNKKNKVKKVKAKRVRTKKLKRRRTCKYSKGEWTTCNAKTKLQSRTTKLVEGNQKRCHAAKTITRRCTPADGAAQPLTLEDKCKNRKFPEKCMKRMQKKKDKAARKCIYIKGDWGPCDAINNVKSRTLTLHNTSPKTCAPTKLKARKCKRSKLCKYKRAKWGTCDPVTKYKSRTDTLKTQSPTGCNATRNVTKMCKQRQLRAGKPCQYKISEWSDCNPITHERNRTKTRIAGDEGRCVPQKIVTRSCIKNNGKERCFFGSYGPYKPCQNGVKTKTRPVIGGGSACQRKAAKTKPCKPSAIQGK